MVPVTLLLLLYVHLGLWDGLVLIGQDDSPLYFLFGCQCSNLVLKIAPPPITNDYVLIIGHPNGCSRLPPSAHGFMTGSYSFPYKRNFVGIDGFRKYSVIACPGS